MTKTKPILPPPHPAMLPEEALLKQCTTEFDTTGGPGGQHRNKVETAVTLRRDGGAEQPAIAWERAAAKVERALEGHLDEVLTLADAAQESGYTASHLKRLHRQARMPMEADGTVLRRHLPKKPGWGVATNVFDVSSSKMQLARAVADGG